VTSGFCREVVEIYNILMYYAAYNGNVLPTFQDNRCDRPCSWISLSFKMGLISCHETAVRNYHYTIGVSKKSA